MDFIYFGIGLMADFLKDGKTMRAANWIGFLIIFVIVLPVYALAAPVTSIKPETRMFVTFDRCMACHNGLTSPSGQDVSIGLNWQSSMMANSSRDPYWQAAVRRETLDFPQAHARIQDECSACHMPMARYQAHAQGMVGAVFGFLPTLPKNTPNALLAADGVSCTLCHQIQGKNLGAKESFTAGFKIDTEKPAGQRSVFGPFVVDAGRKRVMQSSGRFVPTGGRHMQEAGLCGSCHTLYTHSLDADGKVIGTLPEQMPYLEWLHSRYSERQSCQSCHMPRVKAPMPVSSVLGVSRDIFSRHAFRGGNFFMLKILQENATPLAVKASPQSLGNASVETETHLKTSAATVKIGGIKLSKEILSVEVRITNLAGHKLPTAYPSRRAWIHFTVVDGVGRTLFESGSLNPDGSIAGNDNDLDPALYEPHHVRIDTADQVQIYEAVMVDSEDNVTTGLLSAIRFIKDNRILPEGFQKETAESDIAVQGSAAKDHNFKGGEDRVQYMIPLKKVNGPFKIQAELWYQPIGYRWAHNLGKSQTPETDRFVNYYNTMSGYSALMLTADRQTFR